MSPLLAEAKVDFSRELSALVARTPDGESRAWPVVHTIQVDGVCDEVIAPALESRSRWPRRPKTPPCGSPTNSA